MTDRFPDFGRHLHTDERTYRNANYMFIPMKYQKGRREKKAVRTHEHIKEISNRFKPVDTLSSVACGVHVAVSRQESWKPTSQSHNRPMEAQGERRYSSYSFSTSALDGGEWSAS
jgi:hypothetical protein